MSSITSIAWTRPSHSLSARYEESRRELGRDHKLLGESTAYLAKLRESRAG